ncbi:hypothetical protein [Ideonella sp.]|uniref:hypothetical protein n=1 Tax=Ideonella sp. TaxID=1929293 RepID=UPI0035B426E8
MPALYRRLAASCAVSVAALLAACGGGGSDPASLTYSTDIVRVTAFENQAADVNAFETAAVTIQVTVSNPPSGQSYFFIGDTGTGFQGQPMEVFQLSDTTFEVTLHPQVAQSAGVYTGELSVLLCKDPACNARHELDNDTLPYEVTITPQLRADVVADGIEVASVRSDRDHEQGSMSVEGDSVVIEFTSSIPVTLHYSRGLPGEPVVEVDPSSTDTYLKVRVSRAGPNGGGSVNLMLWPDDSSWTIQHGVAFDVSFMP